MAKGKVAIWLVSLVTLIACGRPAAPVGTAKSSTTAVSSGTSATQPGQEPSLVQLTAEGALVAGGQVTLRVTVESPVATAVGVQLVASPAKLVDLERDLLEVSLAAGQRKTVAVTGRLKRRGFVTITANANAKGWEESQAAQVGIEVAPPGGVGRVKSLEDHLKSLPVYRDETWRLENEKAELEGRDDAPLEALLDGVRYKKLDGSYTDPERTTVTFLSGTGKGSPSRGELDDKPKAAPEGVVRPLNSDVCGQYHNASFKLVMTLPPDGLLGTYNPDGSRYHNGWGSLPHAASYLKVSVFDNNGWLQGSTLIASGFTDATGRFNFAMPNCDTAWSDTGEPDIWIQVDSYTSKGNGGVKPMRCTGTQPPTPVTYSFQFGTRWDYETQGGGDFEWQFHSADGGTPTQAAWVAKFTQDMMDFSQDTDWDHFPLWVDFPVGWTFAPVGRIILEGKYWFDPNPLLHEFGHEVMWYNAMPGYYRSINGHAACGLVNPAYLDHANYNWNISNPFPPIQGFQEGWATYFYEAAAEYFRFREAELFLGRECLKENLNFDCLLSLAAPGTGRQYVARNSTFLWRYTEDVLLPTVTSATTRDARRPYVKTAYNLLRRSLYNFGTYDTDDAGICGFWQRTLKNSFPYGGSTDQVRQRRWRLGDIHLRSTISCSLHDLADPLMPSPIFDPEYYRAAYSDLSSFSDADLSNHFNLYGSNEGRRASAVLDVGYYKSIHSDLTSFSNRDATAHYLNYGVFEGRRGASNFYVADYKQCNPDLSSLTHYQATLHYLRQGRFETWRPTTCSIVAPGLVAEYRLAEYTDSTAQTIQDFSGNNRHATRGSTASAESNDAAWLGVSLSFNGTNQLATLPNSVLAGPNQDFTVITVLNSEAAAGDGVNRNAWSWGGTANYARPHLQRTSANRLKFGGYNADIDAGPIPGQPFLATYRYNAAINQINAVVNRFATNLSLTMGGNEAWTATGGKLGSSPSGSNEFWKGRLYWMAFYNRRLTDAEVIQNYDYAKRRLAGYGVTLP